MQSNYLYYIFSDQIDLDDNGDEQASVYRTSISSAIPLEVKQIVQLAEQRGDWRIAYSEGDWDRIDTYAIEEKDSSGTCKVIADRYSP